MWSAISKASTHYRDPKLISHFLITPEEPCKHSSFLKVPFFSFVLVKTIAGKRTWFVLERAESVPDEHIVGDNTTSFVRLRAKRVVQYEQSNVEKKAFVHARIQTCV